MDGKDDNPMGKAVHINEARIKDHHLGEMVRDAVDQVAQKSAPA